MNQITLFNHLGNDIRVIMAEDGEPFFVASDIAKILGYRDAYNMTRRLDTWIKKEGNLGGTLFIHYNPTKENNNEQHHHLCIQQH